MRRATPALVLSAAGLTWLLHAQGIIDRRTTSSAGATPTRAGSTTTPLPTSPPFATEPQSGATPTTTTTPSATGATTVDGPVEDTRWGPVQVEVVVQNHRLTDVRVLQYPSERQRSVEINTQALPILHDEAIAAQSANIDSVSGATVTSEGYIPSLQAALDQAKLGG